jgi:hypothetical protein
LRGKITERVGINKGTDCSMDENKICTVWSFVQPRPFGSIAAITDPLLWLSPHDGESQNRETGGETEGKRQRGIKGSDIGTKIDRERQRT